MFIGHFAVAFAAKKAAPRASLGTLVVAATFLDVVWPVLVLLGIESFRIAPGITAFSPFDFQNYPWSHSLFMAVVWSVLVGGGYRAASADRAGALWVGAAVASHWVLDFLTHRPDMPLYPGGAGRVGLGLWNSVPATFAVEGLMFLLAVVLYAKTTRARDRAGSIGWWAFVALLLLLYIPSPFSPPPPGERAVAVVGILALLVFTPWAYWIDRHREIRPAPAIRMAGSR
jgi:membrane-bound metal-dependent hydrolase YbcI (DUF457 family)